MTAHTASTVLNYSPRKARLIIDTIRGLPLSQAITTLRSSSRPKSKKIYHLLLSAASNLKLTEDDYALHKVGQIVAEEAQRLYRVMPRARGSANRIRRRYSRIKVILEPVVGKK